MCVVSTITLLCAAAPAATRSEPPPAWRTLGDHELVAYLYHDKWRDGARKEIICRMLTSRIDADHPLARELLMVFQETWPKGPSYTAFLLLRDTRDERISGEVCRALVSSYRNAPSRFESRRALRCLGELGDPRALPALEEAVESDKGVAVHGRQIAMTAIQAMGHMGPAGTPFLLRVLGDPKLGHGCREDVVWALGNTGDAAGIPALAEILADLDGNQYLRGMAADALGRIGGNEAAAVLGHYREDRNPRARERVLAALAQLPESPAPSPATLGKTGTDSAKQKGTVQGAVTPAPEPVLAENGPPPSAVTGRDAGAPQAVQAEPSLTWPYLIMGCVGSGTAAAAGIWLLLRRRAGPPRPG